LEGHKESTATQYRYAFVKYARFTKMTPEELIKEKWDDMRKEPIEQTDAAENRLRAFNRWLLDEYTSRKGKKGLSPKSALMNCAAIVDFYARNKVSLGIKMTREFTGATKGVNETEKMSAEQIESLAYYAPTLRDKAIIWCMFQGGMDISTVCSLNCGHVMEEIEYPPMGAVILQHLERKKERGRTFSTFIYKTAVKHLEAYLKERFGEDYTKKMKYDAPLFVNEYGRHAGERYPPRSLNLMLKQIAPHTGIANSRMKLADLNPLRPHALRASFSDQMAKAGASKQLIDYLMGHKLQFDTAYFGGETGLREAYVRYAEVVLEPKRAKQTQELEEDFSSRIEELKSTIIEQTILMQKMGKEKELTESKLRKLEDQVNLLIKELQTLPVTEGEIERLRADLFYGKFKEQEEINKELRTALKQAFEGIKEMKENYEKRIKELEEKT